MQEFKFILTADESNLIIQSLGEMPFRIVSGLINKMQTQAAPQIAAQKAPEKKPEPEKVPATDPAEVSVE